MPQIPLMPPTASNFAERFNPIFGALLALTFVLAGGVIVIAAYFGIRYREGSKAPRERPETATPKLELLLIGVPTLMGLFIFAWGASLYSAERTLPRNATEYLVVGKQWMWHIYHPDGVREINSLTLPIGKPARLTMISQDVVHSFYIPAFRVQYYVLPGRYTGEWFTPTQVGSYPLLCNQYCGADHSRMIGTVTVLSQSDYSNWLMRRDRSGRAPAVSLVDQGKILFSKEACGTCHGDVDTPRAPSLKGLLGRSCRMSDGTVITADEDYIRNSITQPLRFRVAGYPDSMISYSHLDPGDVYALVKYVEAQ